jgi:hypothetical protein
LVSVVFRSFDALVRFVFNRHPVVLVWLSIEWLHRTVYLAIEDHIDPALYYAFPYGVSERMLRVARWVL